MKYKILTAIHNIEFKEDINEEFKELFRLTNNSTFIKSFFTNQKLNDVIGLNEVNSIIEKKAITYTQIKIKDKAEKLDEYNSLILFLKFNEIFFHSLWLVKDNSVRSELGHIITYNDSELPIKIHSNYLNSFSSDSKGKFESTVFSKNDIIETKKIFDNLYIVAQNKGESTNDSIKLLSTSSRLNRAFYLLQSARNTSEIGTKISHYCSTLESLFSVSNTELRHRLSEVIALFLENSLDKRKAIYKSIQTAYDIRSSVTHGDGISTKFTNNEAVKLIQVSLEIDEITRLCFKKIILNPNLMEIFTEWSKDAISEYFQNLILK